MKLSTYAQELLDSGSGHIVSLSKEGKMFIGFYNSLSCWGKVYDSNGFDVETLEAKWDSIHQSYLNFLESDFVKAGYSIQR